MCLQHPAQLRIATPLGGINYPTVGPPKMCGNKLCTRYSGFAEAQIMWALLKLQVTPSRIVSLEEHLTWASQRRSVVGGRGCCRYCCLATVGQWHVNQERINRCCHFFSPFPPERQTVFGCINFKWCSWNWLFFTALVTGLLPKWGPQFKIALAWKLPEVWSLPWSESTIPPFSWVLYYSHVWHDHK